MRNLAIVGIVLVLLALGIGGYMVVRSAGSASAASATGANAATGGGGVPGIPFLGRVGGTTSNGTTSTAQTTTVDQGEVLLTVSATGHVVAKQDTNLAFQQSGVVKTVAVKVGDKVKTGTVLATLDNTAQQNALAKAQNNLTAAQTSLDKLLQPVSKTDIEAAEANVKSAMASYQSAAHSGTSAASLKAYELQYEKALKGVEAANAARAGAGGQYAADDVNYQKAIANVGTAQITADQAKINLDNAKRSGADLTSETANIALQQAKLAQTKAGPSQTDLDAAQAQIEVAQVQLLQAQHNIELAQIVAPFDGVVSTVNVKAGELASGTAFVLVDTGTLYIDVNVDEADIADIRVGLPVTLTLDAIPDAQITGKVQRITPLADASSSTVVTYTVRVELDPTTVAIKSGMTASATFKVQDKQNVTRVSNTYLKTNKTYNQTTVNLIGRNGTTSVVAVTLGVQGTDYSEIIDGLRVGDRIASAAITTPTTLNNGAGLPPAPSGEFAPPTAGQ